MTGWVLRKPFYATNWQVHRYGKSAKGARRRTMHRSARACPALREREATLGAHVAVAHARAARRPARARMIHVAEQERGPWPRSRGKGQPRPRSPRLREAAPSGAAARKSQPLRSPSRRLFDQRKCVVFALCSCLPVFLPGRVCASSAPAASQLNPRYAVELLDGGSLFSHSEIQFSSDSVNGFRQQFCQGVHTESGDQSIVFEEANKYSMNKEYGS